jgi:hypothetical protein
LVVKIVFTFLFVLYIKMFLIPLEKLLCVLWCKKVELKKIILVPSGLYPTDSMILIDKKENKMKPKPQTSPKRGQKSRETRLKTEMSFREVLARIVRVSPQRKSAK